MYGLSKILLSSASKVFHTGWLPPLPDSRDYTEQHPEILKCIHKLGLQMREKRVAPDKADLRAWCSPVEDQGEIGSCTANAAAGAIEYFERRSFGRHTEASRLFIYKTTRNIMGTTGDTGAWLRTTMGAIALCGVPSEAYWPYTDSADEFDKEPTAFIYSIARKYKKLQYFCHDPITAPRDTANVLQDVKNFIAAGIPCMFGFFGFPSVEQGNIPGGIPYPCKDETPRWGHAVVAVGYDDNIKIKNLNCDIETTGALLFRNSWGILWGEYGYGWLPYAYILNRLAVDFWSIISMEWIDTEQFGLLK